MDQEKMVMGTPPEKEFKSRKGLVIFLACVACFLVIGIVFFRSRFTPPEAHLSETITRLPTKEGISIVTVIPASVEPIEKEEPSMKSSIAQLEGTQKEPSPPTSISEKILSSSAEKSEPVEPVENEEPPMKSSIVQLQEKGIELSESVIENFQTASGRPKNLKPDESKKNQVKKRDRKTDLAISDSKNELKYYIVQKGDCLWGISRNPDIFGNPLKWNLIFDANRNKIDNPDLIHAGQKLIILKLH